MGAATVRQLCRIMLLPLIGLPATPVAQTDGLTLNVAALIVPGNSLNAENVVNAGYGANPAGQTIRGPVTIASR
jgi:hypothetical protein